MTEDEMVGWHHQLNGHALCGTHGSLRMMHGGCSARSCCAFTHRVAFEEGSGPRVLLKSGPGNRGRSACGPTHVARLEFPRETGLILRCAGKAGNPFQCPGRNADFLSFHKYLFSSYYVLVGPDVGLRAGRGHGQQAWQGPDPQHLRPPAPQPFRLGGSLPVPQLFSSPVCTTVPTIQSLPGY